MARFCSNVAKGAKINLLGYIFDKSGYIKRIKCLSVERRFSIVQIICVYIYIYNKSCIYIFQVFLLTGVYIYYIFFLWTYYSLNINAIRTKQYILLIYCYGYSLSNVIIL